MRNDKERPVCANCGSTDVKVDAWATWSDEDGAWELGEYFDHAHCEACREETSLDWVPVTETKGEAHE